MPCKGSSSNYHPCPLPPSFTSLSTLRLFVNLSQKFAFRLFYHPHRWLCGSLLPRFCLLTHLSFSSIPPTTISSSLLELAAGSNSNSLVLDFHPSPFLPFLQLLPFLHPLHPLSLQSLHLDAARLEGAGMLLLLLHSSVFLGQSNLTQANNSCASFGCLGISSIYYSKPVSGT